MSLRGCGQDRAGWSGGACDTLVLGTAAERRRLTMAEAALAEHAEQGCKQYQRDMG
jgi:hypothetical protein